MKYRLTIYYDNGSVTHESTNINDIKEVIEKIQPQKEEPPKEEKAEPHHARPLTPFERCKRAVYATGNKWAIENFNATH
mgnify:CR=1 FL=1